MTALAASVKLDERYPGRSFAYPVASGFHVYAGGLVGVNAAYALQPAGSAGVVAIAGICQTELDNTAGANTGQMVNVARGTWALPVASATAASIGAPVYAVDDSGCSTSSNSGANLPAGVLAAIESGRAWVRI